MAKKRKQKKAKQPALTAGLYLLFFHFDEPGEKETTGTFQLVVNARDPDDALDKAASHLRELRVSGDLFDRAITLYLSGGVLLTGDFDKPLLVNWEQHFGGAVDGTLSNLSPERNRDAHSFEWKATQTKDGAVTPFLDFGGFEFRRALASAKGRVGATQVGNDRGRPSAPHTALRLTQPASKKGARRANRAERGPGSAARRAAVARTIAEMKGRK